MTRSIGIVALLLTTVLLAACGGGGGDGSSTQAETEPAQADTSTTAEETSGGELAAAEKKLTEYREDPEFVAPGPPVDAAKAKGHKVFYLAADLSIPTIASLSKALEEAGEAAGVSVEICDGKGSPDNFSKCMDQAISTLKAGDVIINSGIPAELLAAQIKRASDKGIKIINDSESEEGQPPPLPEIDAVTNPDYRLAGELGADEITVDSDGEATVLGVVSIDFPDSIQYKEGFEAELGKVCPECELEWVETSAAEWSNQIGTLVRTALTSNPDIDYMAPTFDGMVQFVAPALRQAGAGDRVKIVTSNTTPSVMEEMAKKEIVLANADVLGGDWMSWAWMDDSLRLITGMEPVQDSEVPTRLFDWENIGEIDPAGPKTAWFGEDFQTAYEELWGVGA